MIPTMGYHCGQHALCVWSETLFGNTSNIFAAHDLALASKCFAPSGCLGQARCQTITPKKFFSLGTVWPCFVVDLLLGHITTDTQTPSNDNEQVGTKHFGAKTFSEPTFFNQATEQRLAPNICLVPKSC